MMRDDLAREIILDQMTEGVIIANTAGELVYINTAAKHLHGIDTLGVSPANYAATYNLSTIDGNAITANELPLARAVLNGETIRGFRFRIGHPNGRQVVAIASATPVYDVNNEQIGSVLSVSDDTERYGLEQRLIQLNASLEARIAQAREETARAANAVYEVQHLDAIGRLTGGIAHEINNTLLVVMTCLEEAIAAQPSGSRLASTLADAMTASERGAQLASDLLAYAQRQPLDPGATDVATVFKKLDQMLHSVQREGIDVALSQQLGGLAIYVDPTRLIDAIFNLALNAIDAMPDGGRLQIEARLTQAGDAEPQLKPGDYYEIVVTDTGTGMTPETLARAMDPFFTTRPSSRARGLGLSAVDGFARQSGGCLQLESAPGQGTVARLLIPAVQLDTSPTSRRRNVNPDGRHVLLVEDDAQVALSVQRRVERLGYRVTVLGHPDLALDALEQGLPVDILFSDITIHGRPHGVTLAQRVSAQWPELPIILTSGNIAGIDRRDIPPGVAFLAKPYREQALRDTLDQAGR